MNTARQRHGLTEAKLVVATRRSASAILICLGLLFSGCASSRLGTTLNVGVVSSATWDYVETRRGIDRGAQEANWFGDDAWAQAVVKAAGVGAVLGLAQVAEMKGKPVLAHVVRVLYIAVTSAAAVHNRGVYR